jgi:hypothetical protein
MPKPTKTERRAYRFCSIEELTNLHDDAVECDDFEWADKIKAELDARGYKPTIIEEPRVVDNSDMPF